MEAWLAGKTEAEPEPPGPVVPAGPAAPAPAATLSARLDVDRGALGRGVLITTVSVDGAGTLRQRGKIVTADGPVRACEAGGEARTGQRRLRCRLSARVRRHLGARWIRLRLRTELRHAGGDAVLERVVLLPRQGR